MKTHTLLVALAVTVHETPDDALPAFEAAFDGLADHVSVIGVLDREVPANNYEPQIFAAWPDEGKKLIAFGVEPGFGEMEHAP